MTPTIEEIKAAYQTASDDHGAGWEPLGEWAGRYGEKLIAEIERLQSLVCKQAQEIEGLRMRVKELEKQPGYHDVEEFYKEPPH